LTNRPHHIDRRLHQTQLPDCSRPMVTARTRHDESADRSQAIVHGGIAAIQALARQLGLIAAIDRRLHLLQMQLPSHESDHVLHLASNPWCEGSRLQDF
jgi:hypothetical protein